MNYKPSTFPIAREAWPFAVPVLGVSAILIATRLWPVGAFGLLVGAYILYFFRNPERQTDGGADAVISPADGVIVAAGIVPSSDFPDGQALRVAVFMSLFNCHINWAPVTGRVESATYIPGRFLNAMDDKASEENERKILRMGTTGGHRVIVKLVAGLVARRIVSPIDGGDHLTRGEKVGLIRFGSRAEVLLPAASDLRVQVGQRVRGGQTVVAELTAAPNHADRPRNLVEAAT